MKLTWREREWRRHWARKNPDKVREANHRWRAANVLKVRMQARERMRRWRARRKRGAKSAAEWQSQATSAA